MIRAAVVLDSPQVSPLFILSMDHIAGIYANSNRNEDAIPIFDHFFRRSKNQYSYENTLVYEENGQILGAVTGYNGADLQSLRQPVLDHLLQFNPAFEVDNETEAGEYYLDCVSVHPDAQGKGVGKKLLQAFCDKGFQLGFTRIGLIVDLENPDAKRLYEKVGFISAGEKDFMGHRYEHMIREKFAE
jgi:ribosomal protein S18 acetylase RimI-like enzyme